MTWGATRQIAKHYRLVSDDLTAIQGLILTHAHFDHYGGIFDIFSEAANYAKIPPIFCSEPTRNLFLKFGYKEWIALSKKPRQLDPAQRNIFFNALRKKIVPLPLGQPRQIGDIEIILLPASHILGSTQVYVCSTWKEGLITFDFKPSGTFLLPAFTFRKIQEQYNLTLWPNFIIIESTYAKNDPPEQIEDVERDIVQCPA